MRTTSKSGSSSPDRKRVTDDDDVCNNVFTFDMEQWNNETMEDEDFLNILMEEEEDDVLLTTNNEYGEGGRESEYKCTKCGERTTQTEKGKGIFKKKTDLRISCQNCASERYSDMNNSKCAHCGVGSRLIQSDLYGSIDKDGNKEDLCMICYGKANSSEQQPEDKKEYYNEGK